MYRPEGASPTHLICTFIETMVVDASFRVNAFRVGEFIL